MLNLITTNKNFFKSFESSFNVNVSCGKDSMKEIMNFYKNYLHSMMFKDEDWKAFKTMWVEAYSKDWTYYIYNNKSSY